MSDRPEQEAPLYIWATRGRTWGFRFLRTGGFADPLPVYEQVFAHVPDDPAVWRCVQDKGALRFPDPDGRRDASGRVIPHEFVLLGPLAADITSLDDGRERMWHEVSQDFQHVWASPTPPSPRP